MKDNYRKQNQVPPILDVTLGNETMSISREEAVDPRDWIPIDDFMKMVDRIRHENGLPPID